MHTSFIVAAVVAIGLGAGSVPAMVSSAHAEGMVSESKEAIKGTGKSMKEATGQLKTDANTTKDHIKALDIEKTKKGSGDVKKDVKDLKGSAMDTMKNPLGK